MDKDTRNAIERATQRARKLLEEDFAAQLEGDFDVHKDGEVATNAGKHLSARQAFSRERIVAATEHKRAAGMSPADAARDYLRDAAFTTLNRFVALKMLEARELLQECITKGEESAGYREFCGMAPGLPLLPDSAGYRLYIEALFDELSTEVKVLFDRRDPSSVLWPKRATFEQLLDILNAPELARVWCDDETIGWVYQFFNGQDERRQMREESSTPRNSRELAIRNQFFTPRYVVQFLTDNTLGRIWYEMRGTKTILAERCEYMVRKPGEEFAPREKKDPRDLRVLDPACGSGHFLLYAFDLLLAIYEEAYADPESPKSDATGKTLAADYASLDAFRKAVPGLVLAHNLHGVDIDPRCAQIAQLALWMRAQKVYRDFGIGRAERAQIRRSNIVVAEPLVADEQIAREFVARLGGSELGRAFMALVDSLKLAGDMGLLLRVEQLVRTPAKNQGDLFQPPEESFRAALEQFARDEASCVSTRRRLFADDAAHGVALLGVAEKGFDVVLMNPPFGDPSTGAREFMKESYPDTWSDLYQSFVQRSLELTVARRGVCGCLSSRTVLINASSEPIRRRMLSDESNVFAIADLGYGVLDAAMVEACAYVYGNGIQDGSTLVVALLRTADKQGGLHTAIESVRTASCSDTAFSVSLHKFANVFRSPWAYWLSDSMLRVLIDSPAMEDSFARVRVGLSTADNFRFLRLRWEVLSGAIGVRNTWVPIAKGGEYSPLFDDIHLVLKWREGGKEIHSTAGATVRSSQDYFMGGTTYPYRTTSALSLRILPKGAAFADGGPAIIPSSGTSDDCARLLAIYNTRVGRYFAEVFLGEGDAVVSGSAARNYIPRAVGAVPLPSKEALPDSEDEDLQTWLQGIVYRWFQDETSYLFNGLLVPGEAHSFREACVAAERAVALLEAHAIHASAKVEGRVERSFGVSSSDRETLDESMGCHPAQLGTSRPTDSQIQEACDLLSQTTDELVDLVSARLGNARYLSKKAFYVSRQLELTSRMLRAAPIPLLSALPDSVFARHQPAYAEAIVSVAVGVAFGRWFTHEAVSRKSAGAAGFEGLTLENLIEEPTHGWGVATHADIRPILVDDPGAKRDITTAIKDAIERIAPSASERFVDDIELVLGAGPDGLRRWLAQSFFEKHLARYSKSRRQAPIYWQLASPSASYSVWLYIHAFSKDTLFRVQNDFVAHKIEHEERRLDSLARELRDGASVAQRKALAMQEVFVEELRVFLEEVKRVAPLWNPNLDDGVIINFAPLWRLVPQNKSWQKELKATWDALCEGKYDWAHLAMHLWPERVVQKCAKDRSLAIAHGLEDGFWVEGTDGKWTARKTPTKSVDELVKERTSPAVKSALKSLLEAPVASGKSTGRKGGGRRKTTAAAEEGDA